MRLVGTQEMTSVCGGFIVDADRLFVNPAPNWVIAPLTGGGVALGEDGQTWTCLPRGDGTYKCT